MLLDGVLYLFHARIRRIADPVLNASAEEVRIASVWLVDMHEDDPAIHAVLESASSAPQRPLQVVIVTAPALAGVAPLLEQLLDPVE
ncbi:hypothetical protein [Mesorhizobium japonicum]|uniref:hypothetical protein n=1 Tax=Mesorhizobium japonicum TaxID=2066070 RepID=UPI003B5AA911